MAKQGKNMADFKKVKGEKFDSAISERVHLPSISFNSEQLPEIKNWEVGQAYEVALQIKQTSLSQERDKKFSAGFDIVGVKVLNNPKSKKDIRLLSDKDLDEKVNKIR